MEKDRETSLQLQRSKTVKKPNYEFKANEQREGEKVRQIFEMKI